MEELKREIEQIRNQISEGVKVGRIEMKWGGIIIDNCNKALTLYSVSKRLFVAEIVSKYKTEIISTEFTDKQEAENFIITMKEGFTYKNSELVILNVC